MALSALIAASATFAGGLPPRAAGWPVRVIEHEAANENAVFWASLLCVVSLRGAHERGED